ncbi:hypothetical protein [Oceanidesulfovibrio marinus]|uniref:Uncharacterized protein n=1 Tax=Oceanidesulfovibrio marinus TaxID=370038 RepID=A0A6P1ZAQ1_9BACT|nr:hypothetical protein [Oceanidesulfovibrio marinus]TVM30257.1 hypothetical protein DQK91_21380 [Oceanidesulfovibrio marinus]
MGWYEDFQALMQKQNAGAQSQQAAAAQPAATNTAGGSGRQLPDLRQAAFQGTPQFPTPTVDTSQGDTGQGGGFGLGGTTPSLAAYAKAGGADTETMFGTAGRDWAGAFLDATKQNAQAWNSATEERAAQNALMEKLSGQYDALQQSLAAQQNTGPQVDPARIALAIDNGWNGVQPLEQFEWMKKQQPTMYSNQNFYDLIDRLQNRESKR